ncbi:MAG: hypothetical protein ACPLXL_00090 [Minisyncoccia bacterium]
MDKDFFIFFQDKLLVLIEQITQTQLYHQLLSFLEEIIKILILIFQFFIDIFQKLIS